MDLDRRSRRCGPLPLRLLQRAGKQGGAGTECVVERGDAVPAPCGSDSEPGQYGQGVRGARAADALGGDRSADAGHVDQPFGRRPDARTAGRVPAGAGWGPFGSGPSDRRCGELPGPEGKPEFSGASGAARGDGKPDLGSAPGFQPGGREL